MLLRGVNTLRTYDWNMVETWSRCPLEYKIKFVDKNRRSFPTGDEYFVSRILHVCIYMISSLPPEMRELRAVEDIFYKTVKQAKIKIGREKGDSLIIMLMRFLELGESRLPIHMSGLKLERTFGNIKLRTRVEYLGQERDGYVLINFKMRRNGQLYLQNSEEEYLQLWYTLFILPGIFRHKMKRIGFYYFLEGRCNFIEFHPDAYVRAIVRIQTIIQKFESKMGYLPRLNPLCPSCGYRHQCPAIHLERSEVVRRVSGLAV